MLTPAVLTGGCAAAAAAAAAAVAADAGVNNGAACVAAVAANEVPPAALVRVKLRRLRPRRFVCCWSKVNKAWQHLDSDT